MSGHLDLNTGCVVFPGPISADGYRRITKREGSRYESVYAHRLAYEQAFGGIPTGCEVHHACRNRACSNPMHLVALSTADHGTEHRLDKCRNGHAFTPENTYTVPRTGERCCRTCRTANQRRRTERRRRARAEAVAA
jgi:hypothetical protein